MASQPSCPGTPKATYKRKCPLLPQPGTNDSWKDVNNNIRKMDTLYDASFYSWLKNEQNVLVTSVYLHRIANEYSIDRVIASLKWLIVGWRIESIVLLIRHITLDWAAPISSMPEDTVLEKSERKRALLVRDLTKEWRRSSLAKLVGGLLSGWTCMKQKESFLTALTIEWDFRRLSEFFSYLQTSADLDYRVKVSLLQEAVRRDKSRHEKHLTLVKSSTIIPSRRRYSKQATNLISKKFKTNSGRNISLISQNSGELHSSSISVGALAPQNIDSFTPVLPLASIAGARYILETEVNCCCSTNSCSHQARNTSIASSSSPDTITASEGVEAIGNSTSTEDPHVKSTLENCNSQSPTKRRTSLI
ncbi:hypothetical protein K493DRAFT_337540 [Basidiobolus meristosporus CBS 931.73]|uniref:Uncharacterized protein n=1 Tax=Basidiobolus meristosporus CBS 931.73 TaxID=1314790 RepID=A0A1Y1YAM1_9FUNG|nr:hypothetical protein K493DRAFT_337540 [Basidiobolus meristosporus CBS 931.73]|eukprot:ORX94965.1 hypothetical protein K493DRAFT_337540 [Basidiobolus meristosporus CBS 931.73]